MAALICKVCSAVYSVGAEKCPQCEGNDPAADYETTVEAVREAITKKAASKAKAKAPTSAAAPAGDAAASTPAPSA
jgi:RNA polymerase subunit RPABC4/transcription elongation factor Spt4